MKVGTSLVYRALLTHVTQLARLVLLMFGVGVIAFSAGASASSLPPSQANVRNGQPLASPSPTPTHPGHADPHFTPPPESPSPTATNTATPTLTPACGTVWRRVPAPVEADGDVGGGISAFSSSDIWGVGAYADASGRFHTLTEHWDGTAWSIVPSPDLSADYDNDLRDVVALAPDNAWAVGYGGATYQTQPMILHWDGTVWSNVPVPSTGLPQNDLYSISALAPDDIWAVGFAEDSLDGRSLLLHYDGISWTAVDSPLSEELPELHGVSMLASDDAWAVGWYLDVQTRHREPLALHWDGTYWTRNTTPNPALGSLGGVAVVAHNDVWAHVDAGGLLHYDGTSWTQVSLPGPQGGITSITAHGANDVWAVGFAYGGAGALLLHWDGTGWMSYPNLADAAAADVTIIGPDDVWAIGLRYDGVQHVDYLHYSDPCSTPLPTSSPTATATGTLPTATSTPSSTATHTRVPTYTSTPIYTATPTSATTATTETATATPTVCNIQFTDVLPGSTFFSSVECMACMGIVDGYTSGCETGSPCFRPSNEVTRGQISKIVSNAAGYDDSPSAQIYEDVPPGSTFYDYVQRLALRGFISGYACGGAGEPCTSNNMPYFRPNAGATRGQISKIVASTAGYIDQPGAQLFEDVAPGSTFYDYVQGLAMHRAMNGYPCGGSGEPCDTANRPYFRPANSATRGQLSKIVSIVFFPDCQLGR